MSSRLRSLDSKITFFAFADIITAVSGVLIFVALLLATDLGRPTASQSQTASARIEQQLQQTLARQLAMDEQNRRLAELLATAQTSPDPAKLQADIASLRAQFAVEQNKQAVLTDQMTASQAAIAARDKVLGLTDLNAAVGRVLQEIATLASEDAAARAKMDHLEQQIAHLESQLLKLRARKGQIWLIPEKSLTTKEPILVTVAESGATVDHFDRPDLRQQIGATGTITAFEACLHKMKPQDQYVVFMVKPSGIASFKDLVKSARNLSFEVGYDALEEDRQVHFGTPPPVDETIPSDTSAGPLAQGKTGPNGGGGASGHTRPGGRGAGAGTGRVAGGGTGAAGNVTPGGPGGRPVDGGTADGGGTGDGTMSGGPATGSGAGEASHGGPGTTGNTKPGGQGNQPGTVAGAKGGTGTGTKGAAGTTGNAAATATAGQTNGSSSTATTGGVTAPPAKSWWERLLEWLGLR
jgi:hypothetical protein